jgi:PD-(D/E)XK nuclease superfamily protein
MKKNGARIKHPKLRGEWAELCFMVRATEKGLTVSKPWGETTHYDFVVESKKHFVRVQVKSTTFKDRGGYSCTVRGCRGPYIGDVFDFVAAYLIPEDLWYIIPAEMIRGQGSVALYPQLRKSKYAPYREAWHLLRGTESREATIAAIQACTEESSTQYSCQYPVGGTVASCWSLVASLVWAGILARPLLWGSL